MFRFQGKISYAQLSKVSTMDLRPYVVEIQDMVAQQLAKAELCDLLIYRFVVLKIGIGEWFSRDTITDEELPYFMAALQELERIGRLLNE